MAEVSIFPYGTARLVLSGLFNFQSGRLARGGVIVVSRDLAPLDLGALTVTVSTVLSDFALSAAPLAALSRDN
jgi:hypothetical protein